MAQNDDGPKFPVLSGVTFTGNLTRAPREIRGKERDGAGFGMAANSRTYDGFEGTMFLDCTIWGFWAESVLEHFQPEHIDGKDRLPRAIAKGDLFIDEYEGKPQYRLEVKEIAKVLYPSRDDDGGRGRGRGRSSRNDDEDGGGRRQSRRGGDDEDGGRRSSRRGGDDGDESRSSGRRRGSSDNEGGGRRRRSSSDDAGDSLD